MQDSLQARRTEVRFSARRLHRRVRRRPEDLELLRRTFLDVATCFDEDFNPAAPPFVCTARERAAPMACFKDMRRERVLMVLSFLAIHIVWGSTYLAIRYSIETIPPLITAGLRHVIGGSALFAWCWWRGYRPTLRQWQASAVLGVLFFLIGHGSLHWAELVVPSGVAALLIATEPVWVAALSAISVDRLRLNASGIGGLIIGIAAVAILIGKP
ncbi:MAG: hypothetical protein DMF58_20440, partial [Acidobacteria bacterium]